MKLRNNQTYYETETQQTKSIVGVQRACNNSMNNGCVRRPTSHLSVEWDDAFLCLKELVDDNPHGADEGHVGNGIVDVSSAFCDARSDISSNE